MPAQSEPDPGTAVAPTAPVADVVPQAVTPAPSGQETATAAAAAQTTSAASGYVPKTPYDNTPYRFDMSQQGKRMSAADFDAWMKARGLRVAGGKPAESAATTPDAPDAAAAPASPTACQPAATQAC